MNDLVFNSPSVLEVKTQLMPQEIRNHTIENKVKVYMQAIKSMVL